LLDFVIFNGWINILLLSKWNNLAYSKWNYVAVVIKIPSKGKWRHVVFILDANEVAVVIHGPVIITILVKFKTLH